MKKLVLAVLLVLGANALQAQDCLEPIRESKEDSPLCLRFYGQETLRLLNPHHADWGVICLPSLSTESSLTYDAQSQALIYTRIDGILWSNVCDATTERIDERTENGFEYIREIDLDEIRDYHAPATKSRSLAIPNKMAKKLKRLWAVAIKGVKKNDMIVLDGCEWRFFADGKSARAHYIGNDWVRVPRLVKLVDDLMKVVQEDDASQLPSLEMEADEIYRLFTH